MKNDSIDVGAQCPYCKNGKLQKKTATVSTEPHVEAVWLQCDNEPCGECYDWEEDL